MLGTWQQPAGALCGLLLFLSLSDQALDAFLRWAGLNKPAEALMPTC
ncbi:MULTISPECIES: hypothetical protein [Mesorhizobium]|nr:MULTISPECIES: hypothetical protein [Mesorhizobium]